MIIPPKPDNETERVHALRRLNVLDTQTEERFDRVVRLAQKLFNVPIALVSLVDSDRQWFKSKIGIDAPETSRDLSFCGHAILQDEIMIVEDATQDMRFKDNPLVTGNPNIKFYLGCPLKVNQQFNIGTFCLIDKEKRSFSEEDLKVMEDLAHILQAELEAIQLSTTDELTELSNRRGFLLIGNYIFDLCERENRPITLLFFDLDNFKHINDTFGHAEGDKVLKIFSQYLKENFRNSDVIGRLGGDEFCVLCTGLGRDKISQLVKRFKKSLTDHANANYPIQYSLGCIQFNKEKHKSLGDFLDEADKRMYENKRLNREPGHFNNSDTQID